MKIFVHKVYNYYNSIIIDILNYSNNLSSTFINHYNFNYFYFSNFNKKINYINNSKLDYILLTYNKFLTQIVMSSVIDKIILLSILLLSFIFLLSLVSKCFKHMYNFIIFSKIFSILEQDIFNLDDFNLIFFFLFGTFITFLIMFFKSINLTNLLSYVIHYSFCYFLLSAIILPISLMFTYGLKFLLILKGSIKKPSILNNILEDSISILTFFIRFSLQIARWALIIITFFLLHEFYYETKINSSEFINYNYNFFNYFILLIRNSLEFIDVLFIFSVQIIAFFSVLFWLLGFLFSTSISSIFELFFKKINK